MAASTALARVARLSIRPRPLATRFTRLHAAVLRAARGRIRRSLVFAFGRPVLSLTTTGRRTGRPRSTAVAYFREGRALVVTAANVGSERDPQWALNLEANPNAVVVVDGRHVPVTARRAIGAEERRLWARWVELQPPADSFRRIAGREIPVFVLEPRAPDDAP